MVPHRWQLRWTRIRTDFSTRCTVGIGAGAVIQSCFSSVSPYLAKRARARSCCNVWRSSCLVEAVGAVGEVGVVVVMVVVTGFSVVVEGLKIVSVLMFTGRDWRLTQQAQQTVS
jgi:hypothetical protein